MDFHIKGLSFMDTSDLSPEQLDSISRILHRPTENIPRKVEFPWDNNDTVVEEPITHLSSEHDTTTQDIHQPPLNNDVKFAHIDSDVSPLRGMDNLSIGDNISHGHLSRTKTMPVITIGDGHSFSSTLDTINEMSSVNCYEEELSCNNETQTISSNHGSNLVVEGGDGGVVFTDSNFNKLTHEGIVFGSEADTNYTSNSQHRMDKMPEGEGHTLTGDIRHANIQTMTDFSQESEFNSHTDGNNLRTQTADIQFNDRMPYVNTTVTNNVSVVNDVHSLNNVNRKSPDNFINNFNEGTVHRQCNIDDRKNTEVHLDTQFERVNEIATSQVSQQMDYRVNNVSPSSRVAKPYERRNKKRRPPDYYERVEAEIASQGCPSDAAVPNFHQRLPPMQVHHPFMHPPIHPSMFTVPPPIPYTMFPMPMRYSIPMGGMPHHPIPVTQGHRDANFPPQFPYPGHFHPQSNHPVNHLDRMQTDTTSTSGSDIAISEHQDHTRNLDPAVDHLNHNIHHLPGEDNRTNNVSDINTNYRENEREINERNNRQQFVTTDDHIMQTSLHEPGQHAQYTLANSNNVNSNDVLTICDNERVNNDANNVNNDTVNVLNNFNNDNFNEICISPEKMSKNVELSEDTPINGDKCLLNKSILGSASQENIIAAADNSSDEGYHDAVQSLDDYPETEPFNELQAVLKPEKDAHFNLSEAPKRNDIQFIYEPLPNDDVVNVNASDSKHDVKPDVINMTDNNSNAVTEGGVTKTKFEINVDKVPDSKRNSLSSGETFTDAASNFKNDDTKKVEYTITLKQPQPEPSLDETNQKSVTETEPTNDISNTPNVQEKNNKKFQQVTKPSPMNKSWADLVKQSNATTSTSTVVTTTVTIPSTQATVTTASHVHTSVATSHDTYIKDLGKRLKNVNLHYYPAIPLVPRGLANNSNWCYVNATLQALLACTPIYHLLTSLGNFPSLKRSSRSTPILDVLVKFFNEFHPMPKSEKVVLTRKGSAKGNKIESESSFSPKYIYSMLQSLEGSSSFKTGKQEDAEEFLSLLLNGLHDEMTVAIHSTEEQQQKAVEVTSNGYPGGSDSCGEDDDVWEQVGPRNRGIATRQSNFTKSPISNIFSGEYRSNVSKPGQKDLAIMEPFFTLPLDIQADNVTSVKQALDKLVHKEAVVSSNKSEEVYKRLTIDQLPPILILHLKFFQFNKNGGCQKTNKKISYSQLLEISKDILSPKSKIPQLHRKYELFAVVYHFGKNLAGGHYTADIFHPGYQTWIRYDDETITPISMPSVFSPSFPKVPYLLYYKRSEAPS